MSPLATDFEVIYMHVPVIVFHDILFFGGHAEKSCLSVCKNISEAAHITHAWRTVNV
jgi:hypothetical protein